MEKIITFEGLPGFIYESDNSGLFYLVNKIIFNPESPNKWEYEWNRDDDEIITLRKGMDIIEAPNRNVSVLVRADKSSNCGLCLIQELKKHAQNGGYDYVSAEFFGENVMNLLCNDGKWSLYEARPRYFRKVPLDDR